MLLTFNIGNTNIKSALFAKDEIINFKVHNSVDSVLDYINHINFTKVAVCSVNPSLQKVISNELRSKGIPIYQTTIQQKFNLKINYQTPATLGMDRVCSVVGALEQVQQKKLISEKQFLVTIDLGTASTINVVSPASEFIGGLIAPGIRTMLKSLNEKTAQLPLLDLNSYHYLIGSSTESSIISGVVNATIGMINEIVNKLKEESSVAPIIFVTGGNSKIILPHLHHKVHFDEALVLKGLKVMYELNN